jgi:diaminohydroxyphosphoribosylaminopyrimidine deaminase/5-amino-6-(5-phosphoribosylamino)uracil reductase
MLAAGIARAVIALRDPDPRVNGEGIARLRAGGVAVTEDVGREAAAWVNAGFISRIKGGRPLVTLKLAATLDGRIAAANGESRWITSPLARRQAHLLRATHDAILVGAGTAAADDPALTVRLPGAVPAARPGPVRVVADGRLRLPLTSILVATARETPTWVLTRPGNDRARIGALAEAGCTVIEVPPDQATGQPDLAEGLRALSQRGITRLFVEGGGTLAASLLRADLVDRLAWFGAPALLGGDGVPAVAALGLEGIGAMPRFARAGLVELGGDLLVHLVRAE